jgi:hypothetical protein
MRVAPFFDDSTRTYARDLRSAFPQDFAESALGIDEPPFVVPVPLWLRVLRVVLRVRPWRMQ